MTRKELIVRLSCLLSALLEADGMPIPASIIYLGLGSSLEEYNLVSRAGERLGWLTVTSETVALTESGKVTALEFEKRLGV